MGSLVSLLLSLCFKHKWGGILFLPMSSSHKGTEIESHANSWLTAHCVCAYSAVSDSLPPHGLQPTRLLCPQNIPGKNTGVGCHFLLQGISPQIQGSNSHLLYWQADSLPALHLGTNNIFPNHMLCWCDWVGRWDTRGRVNMTTSQNLLEHTMDTQSLYLVFDLFSILPPGM